MNYIPTAFRVLLLLKLFVKYRTITFARFQDEIAPLLKSSTTEEIFNEVKEVEPLSLSVFRKYVKTLRFLGCNIKTISASKTTEQPLKEKIQAYQLEQHPFPWMPSQTEWLLFLQLFSTASEVERAVLIPMIWNLAPSLAKKFTASIPLNKEKSYERQIPSFLRNAFSEDLQQCIKTIEAIQKSGDGIMLFLKQEKQTHQPPMNLAPHQREANSLLLYQNTPLLFGLPHQLEMKEQGTLQLIIEDVKTYQQHIVPLTLIAGITTIPIEQLLPLRPSMIHQVQFKITGKLVASYEKRENETILEASLNEENEANQVLLVEATEVDSSQLFQRLKRYGQYAELLSPLSLRQQFKQQLQHQDDLLKMPRS
ncbi:MAG: hypothetical protein H2174_02855 [Vampirovibrio sp.]|nr:hypothetical protein [Vampirovibrio sp.]